MRYIETLLVFLLFNTSFSFTIMAEEFGWDVRLNNYTDNTIVENGVKYVAGSESSLIRILRVQSHEESKKTTLQIKDLVGRELCLIVIETRGLNNAATLLSAKATPIKTCKVNSTLGPHDSPLREGEIIALQPTAHIMISILNASEDNSRGIVVNTLLCSRDDLETLAPNIEHIRFEEHSGRTYFYRIILKGGTKEDYDTLGKNAWGRCAQLNADWFIARDPKGLFESTIPPDWRLRGGMKGTQRLYFEKRGLKNSFEAAITVHLLPLGSNSKDDPTTLDDGLYSIETKLGILLVEYSAPTSLFSLNIDKFDLFVEGLVISR